MKRTWTIIGVSDVPTSLKGYQSLFGQPETRPGHADFGQILDSDGTVLLCLHQWGAHEHPSLMSRDEATPGNGLLLFFRVDGFDMALKRARALVARLEEEPHANPNTRTQEFSLRAGIRTDTTSPLVRSLRSSWGATSRRRPKKCVQRGVGPLTNLMFMHLKVNTGRGGLNDVDDQEFKIS